MSEWRHHWPEFLEEVERRLDRGAIEYEDVSFRRLPRSLVEEIEQEIADVAAWSYILWTRIRSLREKADALRQ